MFDNELNTNLNTWNFKSQNYLQPLYEQRVIIYLWLFGWHIGLLVWRVDVTFIHCIEKIDSSYGQDIGHVFGLFATFPKFYVVICSFHIFNNILLWTYSMLS